MIQLFFFVIMVVVLSFQHSFDIFGFFFYYCWYMFPLLSINDLLSCWFQNNCRVGLLKDVRCCCCWLLRLLILIDFSKFKVRKWIRIQSITQSKDEKLGVSTFALSSILDFNFYVFFIWRILIIPKHKISTTFQIIFYDQYL